MDLSSPTCEHAQQGAEHHHQEVPRSSTMIAGRASAAATAPHPHTRQLHSRWRAVIKHHRDSQEERKNRKQGKKQDCIVFLLLCPSTSTGPALVNNLVSTSFACPVVDG